MRLSNKSTFSLTCLILILALAFAAMPAMAGTIEATWTDNLNDDATADDPGWNVTVGGLADVTNIAVTAVIPGGAVVATGDIDVTQPTDAADVDATVNIAAARGTVIAVGVSVTAPTEEERVYQRVTFPVGGPDADDVAETTLTLIPKLKKLAEPLHYVTFSDNTATITFEFEDAVADENGAPSAPLHASDVFDPTDAFDTTGWQVVGVSGTNQVTIRSTADADATSVILTVGLDPAYALAADTTADGQAMVHYDNTAPTITDASVVVEAPPGFGIPTDSIWDSVFILKFSVGDGGTGSGAGTPMVTGPADKVDIGAVGLAPANDTLAGTEYLVRITPKATRNTTEGQEITLTITPVDKAGNAGTPMFEVVKLAAKSQPPVTAATIPTPALGMTTPGGTLTVTFSKDPGTVTATGYTITGSGTTRMITVPADKAAGSHSIALTWANSGSGTVTYTIPESAVDTTWINICPSISDICAFRTKCIHTSGSAKKIMNNTTKTYTDILTKPCIRCRRCCPRTFVTTV